MTIETTEHKLKAALPEGYSMCVPVMDDLPAVVALMNKHSQVLFGHPDVTEDSMRHGWESPIWDLKTYARVVENPQGQVIGYTEAQNIITPKIKPFVFGRIDPDYRGLGISTAMLAWAEDLLRSEVDQAPEGAKVEMGGFANRKDVQAIKMLEDAGWETNRYSWHMVIDLDGSPITPNTPEGITIRSLNPGESEREAYRVVRTAFKDHFGFVDSPFEEAWERWQYNHIQKDDYDPGIRLIALSGDQIVGVSFCMPKIDDDPDQGWVGTLGVLREYRGRGIAKALLLASFEVFRQRGKTRVGLGVDASSLTGATKLYESAGMRVYEEFANLHKVLREGTDLSTQTIQG